MNRKLTFTLYTSAGALPNNWDAVAHNNIFLSRDYLAVLEKSAPATMQCYFIGLFNEDILCGVAIAQYLDIGAIATFNTAEKQHGLRTYLTKRFTSHLLLIGNNKLTGQNAYVYDEALITEEEVLMLLNQTLQQLVAVYKNQKITINLLGIKDFNSSELPNFTAAGFKGYYKFSTQPNMIFTIRSHWHTIDDYLADMSTKYRTQYNRARKKAEGIEKRKLNETEIKLYETRIYKLYITVAKNSAFNTFFLPANHFEVFKRELKDNFLFYGYFNKGELVGFSTLIKNNSDMDTYFLGYDDTIQKEKMLYLNMLYDMVGYAIKKQFKHIIFARSAMEIKSSVGAKPEEVFGLIKHTNPIVNYFMPRLFTYFDPKISWKERNPFKN